MERSSQLSHPNQMPSNSQLPIHEHREAILNALGSTNRLILEAPTGSGKSTQVPQFLLDSPQIPSDQEIVVLQPRRLPTRMLAKRIAQERNTQLGKEIGYQIRFDKVTSAETRIRFVTEGLLLRQMLSDPSLPKVGALIFDEFHERHLYSDLSLALAQRLQAKRPDLKLVVMSATLDSDTLARWLNPCKVIRTEGRTYPVEIAYSAAAHKVADRPVWEQAAHHVQRLAKTYHEGDFLVFMPGAHEIRRTIGELEKNSSMREFDLLPLYGELPPEAQDRAVSPSNRRKVIVSTNVAETSLTIDGVRIVVDSGLARVARYDPARGINSLLIEKISQAAAEQRTGRAGRTAPGFCLRLWSEAEHQHRPTRETPEVHRTDLSEPLLPLIAQGLDLKDFPWLEAPTEHALTHALEVLQSLGALNSRQDVTVLGQRMARFPAHPRYARLLLAAAEYDCVPTACLLAAFTQGRELVLTLNNRKKQEEREHMLDAPDGSDFFVCLAAWEQAKTHRYDQGFCREWGIHAQAARQAEQVAAQFLKICERQDLPTTEPPTLNPDALRKCLLLAFADNLARRRDKGTKFCYLAGGRKGELKRDSVADQANLLVASEITEIEARGEATVLLGMATQIERQWLDELFPGELIIKTGITYDPAIRRVVAKHEVSFRGLVLENKELAEPPASDEAAALLAERVATGELTIKAWDESVEHWIARVNFAAKHYPEYGFSEIDEEGRRMLFEQICYGCLGQKDLKNQPVWKTLNDWLTHEQRSALDTLAPQSLQLPRKNKPTKLRYDEQARVVLAATVQELYDVPSASLQTGDRRVKTRIEILAPNRRPVQLTDDIDAFWNTSYAQVKKDLFGRYPKHEWR